MDTEYTRVAKSLSAEYGKGTERFIATMIADANRGGDPEMIDYWRGVMKAFKALPR